MLRLASLLLLALPAAFAQVATIYWPVSYPGPDSPWVIGEKNLLSWTTGGGTGIDAFDIQLHNSHRSIMIGFIPIALRVKMERVGSGRGNYGGEIEVDLGSDIPTGDGFSLIFMQTLHGQVYAKSKTFSILAAKPDNYTAPALPTATVTATIDDTPNPTQQWALTLDGVVSESEATAIAGNAGSGT